MVLQLTIACRRLQRRVSQLNRSKGQPAREINVEMVEHAIDTSNVNIVLSNIQRDKECDKDDHCNRVISGTANEKNSEMNV